MATCCHIFAVISVLLSTVALIVAFLTPNWIEAAVGTGLSFQPRSQGLWLECQAKTVENCYWYYDNDRFFSKEVPDWWKATQGLFTGGVVSSLTSLLIALFSICCSCRKCNCYHGAAVFSNIAFVLVAVAMCVFGAKAHLERDVSVDTHFLQSHFGWSFWLACGGGVMTLLSTILFYCTGRQDTYEI